MNSITQDMKYRQSLLTYAQKYGVGVSNIGYTSAPEKVKGRVEICEANTTRP